MSKNIFEIASRKKFRFIHNGVKTVEDLWDLSIDDLGKIFKKLNRELRERKEESLVPVSTPDTEELETQIEILQHIATVRTKEKDELLLANAKKQKRKLLETALAEKEVSEISKMSKEDIQKELAEL